jgi:hypothetical protein
MKNNLPAIYQHLTPADEMRTKGVNKMLMTDGQPHVVGVAIEINGCVCAMPVPKRHHHIIEALYNAGMPNVRSEHTQGFLWSDGAFRDRPRSAALLGHQGLLTSEDLW